MSIVGSILGIGNKVLGFLPHRAESLRNKIDKLEHRQAYISINKLNNRAREFERNDKRLWKLRKKLINRAV